MAKPRVFVSSTYYDLKHIRSSLDNFIQSLGFETVLSEKGNIPYSPDKPLDESCYQEVSSVDIFVLIIGGRYGSAASNQHDELNEDFYEKYDSITKKEYEQAVEKGIPIYILIESNVYAEYRTYQKNKENSSVDYAHVDSVNVFELIDSIILRPRNNPIKSFDSYSDIETWLLEQWSGLFKEMLIMRKEQKPIKSLELQLNELSEINVTLKNYLESILQRVNTDEAKEIIIDEDKRLADTKTLQKFSGNIIVRELIAMHDIPIEKIKKLFTDANTLDELARNLAENSSSLNYNTMIKHWKNNPNSRYIINDARDILGLGNLYYMDDD